MQFLESGKHVGDWIEQTRLEVKRLEREIGQLKSGQVSIDALIASAPKITVGEQTGFAVIAAVDVAEHSVLSDLSDKIKNKIGSGVIVLLGKTPDTVPLTVTVTKNLTGALHAGKLLAGIAEVLGGRGGGRPDFAQGAGKNPAAIEKALAAARALMAHVTN